MFKPILCPAEIVALLAADQAYDIVVIGAHDQRSRARAGRLGRRARSASRAVCRPGGAMTGATPAC